MNLDEIKNLIDTVVEKDITEFEYETGGDRIRIRRGGTERDGVSGPPYVVVTSAPASVQGTADPDVSGAQRAGGEALTQERAAKLAEKPPPAEDEDKDLVIVSSPIVGTFYEAASPGAPPYVEVGDRVEPGEVLCIIEAMKLMNEIEAEAGGVIAKRFVANGQPVEYGEALFAIDPKA